MLVLLGELLVDLVGDLDLLLALLDQVLAAGQPSGDLLGLAHHEVLPRRGSFDGVVVMLCHACEGSPASAPGHTGEVHPVRTLASPLPLVARAAAIGAVVVGVLGAVLGLVVGLQVYPPTAGFAVVEVGVPAVVLGAVLGTAVGGVAAVFRRIARR